MKLFKVNEYIDKLKKYDQIIECINCEEFLEREIACLTYNSQNVKKDTMFVCKGFLDNFKEEYLKDALNKGAFIYVSQKKYNVNIPCILVKDAFFSLCIL